MKYAVVVVAFVILLSVTSNYGQRCSSAPTPKANEDYSIRRVDFLNFTYPMAMCVEEFGKDGMPKTASVKDGQFENQSVLVYVVDKDILYGDLTGDRIDEAIVPVHCGLAGANFDHVEILFYTLYDGQPKLFARLDEQDFQRAYHRYHPGSTLWSAIDSLKVTNRKIVIEKSSDGPHCCPKHRVTLEYLWNGSHFVLNGKPLRKPLR